MCQEEASGGGALAAERYFIEVDERALVWPYDPDFESEQYYEHEDRLQLDEDYAEMTRHNANIREEATRRQRQKDAAAWEALFNSAKELVENGPLAHFRVLD
jgi:hypothetical protein